MDRPQFLSNLDQHSINEHRKSLVYGGLFALQSQFDDGTFVVYKEALLLYIDSGALELNNLENESRIVPSGTAVFIPAQTPFFKKCLGRETKGWFISLPRTRAKFMPNVMSSIEYSELAYWLCKKIVCWEFSKCTQTAYQHLVWTLLNELKGITNNSEIPLPFPRDEKLKTVAKKIYDNPADMNTLDYWAKIAAKSRRVFTEAWKCETGLSFGVWRQRLKLLAALRMLTQKKAVSEISTALGYRSTSAFDVMFRKEYGVSPMKYIRAGHRIKKPPPG